MKSNLASLRDEIQAHLNTLGMVIFPCHHRSGDSRPAVYWDTERDGDYRSFVAAAQATGARMVTLFAQELDEEMIDEGLEDLAESGLERDERRGIELRLKEMRRYTGFTCEIELSFDLSTRIYIFDLRTEWFEELTDLLDTLEVQHLGMDEEDEQDFNRGLFSKN